MSASIMLNQPLFGDNNMSITVSFSKREVMGKIYFVGYIPHFMFNNWINGSYKSIIDYAVKVSRKTRNNYIGIKVNIPFRILNKICNPTKLPEVRVTRRSRIIYDMIMFDDMCIIKDCIFSINHKLNGNSLVFGHMAKIYFELSDNNINFPESIKHDEMICVNYPMDSKIQKNKFFVEYSSVMSSQYTRTEIIPNRAVIINIDDSGFVKNNIENPMYSYNTMVDNSTMGIISKVNSRNEILNSYNALTKIDDYMYKTSNGKYMKNTENKKIFYKEYNPVFAKTYKDFYEVIERHSRYMMESELVITDFD
jgi:hypothetical protein|nr:MAG TPA: hypothetical protein [Caudoviricetes sp.]